MTINYWFYLSLFLFIVSFVCMFIIMAKECCYSTTTIEILAAVSAFGVVSGFILLTIILTPRSPSRQSVIQI
jgi:hypothetical protein